MSRSAVGQQIARSYLCWSEIWNIKRLALQGSDISKQQGHEIALKLLNFRLVHFLEDSLDMVRRFDIFMQIVDIITAFCVPL